jgi:hypothetical protein
LFIVLVVGNIDGSDFSQAFERDISEHGNGEEFVDEGRYEFGFEDVSKRDPIEESWGESYDQGDTKSIVIRTIGTFRVRQ